MTIEPKFRVSPAAGAWRLVATRRLTVGVAALALSVAGAAAQAPAPKPAATAATGIPGVWIDDKGDGAIEIGPCGEKLCGRIVWVKDPNDDKGKPLVDHFNPEAGKRKRPICGLPVIGGLKKQANGSWDEGWIYDPKDGKSYDLEVTQKGTDKLQIKGYLGMKFMSETFIWTRAPASQVKCGAGL
jgi:uncharacterized protein (DUF2147 family)